MPVKLGRTGSPTGRAYSRRDVDAPRAASFQDVERDPDRRAADQGVEVREQAILALGELGASAGDDAVVAGDRDRLTLSGALPCTSSAFARRSRRSRRP
jgi:hypothetical protein